MCGLGATRADGPCECVQKTLAIRSTPMTARVVAEEVLVLESEDIVLRGALQHAPPLQQQVARLAPPGG